MCISSVAGCAKLSGIDTFFNTCINNVLATYYGAATGGARNRPGRMLIHVLIVYQVCINRVVFGETAET